MRYHPPRVKQGALGTDLLARQENNSLFKKIRQRLLLKAIISRFFVFEGVYVNHRILMVYPIYKPPVANSCEFSAGIVGIHQRCLQMCH